MELEARLRAFAAFARRRSFSAAAAELRISQPAVSKHVADLERALELKLVERARRDGSLTSAGDFIANHVLRAESLLAQADLGAAQFRKSGSGSLAIVASWLTGTYLLPEIIAEFGHLHPAVHISLELGTAAQAVERLRSHRAELGFIAGAVGGPEIEAEPLLENDIVIVSIHWGSNWGHEIPKDHRRFAHALVERADVSISVVQKHEHRIAAGRRTRVGRRFDHQVSRG